MKNSKLWLLSVFCVVLLISLVAPLSGWAQTSVPPTYYKGKAISIVVGAVTGGSSDILARWISPWLTKYIPGNPSINIINMPGAGGMIGANHFYNNVKKDGLTMLSGSGKESLMSLLQFKGVKYDITKTPMVLASSTMYIYHVKGDLIKDFKDIFDKEVLIFGHLPPGTGTTTAFLLIKELLGFKTKKLILAYGGHGDAWRAYVAGEINTLGGPLSPYMVNVKDLVKTGEAKVLFQTGVLDTSANVVRAFPLEDVPTVYERYVEVHGKPPSGKVWDAMKAVIGAAVMFANTITLPPGVPKEIENIVTDACEKMVKDPKFIADTDAKIKTTLTAGELMKKLFEKNLVRANPEAISWLKTWLREKYNVE